MSYRSEEWESGIDAGVQIGRLQGFVAGIIASIIAATIWHYLPNIKLLTLALLSLMLSACDMDKNYSPDALMRTPTASTKQYVTETLLVKVSQTIP